MTYFGLSWRLVKARGLSNLLAAVVTALGVTMVMSSAAVVEGTRSAVSCLAEKYPMVVGGEVGGVSLVLGALTRLQDLGSGVDYSVYERVKGDPRVSAAVPLLAGHAVSGFPLLATSKEYFEPRERYKLEVGRLFEPKGMEAVVGNQAAKSLGVQLGSELRMEHHHPGAVHDATMLKVVGVLS